MQKTVKVAIEIEVSIDEEKFDEEFMKDFREVFYNFNHIDDHIKHLAQLYARGVCNNGSFIEGYGLAKNMGISFCTVDQDEDII